MAKLEEKAARREKNEVKNILRVVFKNERLILFLSSKEMVREREERKAREEQLYQERKKKELEEEKLEKEKELPRN
jgi:hypothetical protein